MPRRREIPFSPIPTTADVGSTTGSGGHVRATNEYSTLGRSITPCVAENQYQALMECPPGVSPQQYSKVELLRVREALADAIDELPERERWIFEACVIERKAIRHVAVELSLSKSYVHRLLQEARAKLAIELSMVPVVQEYLSR